jgi:hypothetical protein
MAIADGSCASHMGVHAQVNLGSSNPLLLADTYSELLLINLMPPYPCQSQNGTDGGPSREQKRWG